MAEEVPITQMDGRDAVAPSGAVPGAGLDMPDASIPPPRPRRPTAVPAPDAAWSRTPAARFSRSVIQRVLLLPTLRFISPVQVLGRSYLRDLPGPAVFVANHQSHFDAPACLAALGPRIRRRLVIAAAADYFYRKRWAAFLVSIGLGAVPLSRRGAGRSSLELLKNLLDGGWSVLLFPSGTRAEPGVTSASGAFKRGFAYLAVDAKVPVIPLYLSGTDRVMPKGARFPLPGGISVGIGAPIPPGDDYETLVIRTKAAMEELRSTVQRWEAA